MPTTRPGMLGIGTSYEIGNGRMDALSGVAIRIILKSQELGCASRNDRPLGNFKLNVIACLN